MCEHLVEAWGHDEESCRGLMSSRCSGGRQVVALQDILILRLSLVEVVVFSSDAGHLEHVAQRLSSCMREDKYKVFVSDVGNKAFSSVKQLCWKSKYLIQSKWRHQLGSPCYCISKEEGLIHVKSNYYLSPKKSKKQWVWEVSLLSLIIFS